MTGTVAAIANAATVTVACKLPNGLVLQLQEPYTRQENVMGAIKDVTYYRFTGKKVVLNGAAFRYDLGPRIPMAETFALTPNVDAKFWEAWERENADNPALVNGFVFAHAKSSDATAQAQEFKNELCGFEAINPSKLPGEFQRKGSSIQTMERS